MNIEMLMMTSLFMINFKHSAFSYKVLRSIVFREFSDRVNKWEILRSNLPSKGGPATENVNDTSSPLCGKSKVMSKDNEFTTDQITSIMSRETDFSPSTVTTILTAPNASTISSRESHDYFTSARVLGK